jgi:hypothetical protein
MRLSGIASGLWEILVMLAILWLCLLFALVARRPAPAPA